MIIQVKELNEGSNDCSFTISPTEFDDYLQEVDVLYHGVGDACDVSLRVERLDESLFLKGQVEAPMMYECARCLEETTQDLDLSFYWTLFPQTSLDVERLSEEEEVELSEDDLDVSFYEGEEVDLKEIIRELILLELRPAPTCDTEDCLNLEDMDVLITQDDLDDQMDPRWNKLKELKEKLADSDTES